MEKQTIEQLVEDYKILNEAYANERTLAAGLKLRIKTLKREVVGLRYELDNFDKFKNIDEYYYDLGKAIQKLKEQNKENRPPMTKIWGKWDPTK